MTRKDFQLIADAINAWRSQVVIPAETARSLAATMADHLASTNSRFDRERFIRAATTTNKT